MAAPHNPEFKLDWLKLKLVANLGSVGFARLLARFGSPSQVLAASAEQLMEVWGIGPGTARDIASHNFVSPPDRHIEAMERMGARMLTIEDEEYPPLLRHIFAPPPVIFVQGSLWPCHQAAVAIVGSRKYTIYGRRVAEQLAQDLAKERIAVVSGLARGIDTYAHEGALEGGGYTVGVLACSLDYPYPPENIGLIKTIAEKGAVLSEYLIGTSPQPGLFPVRNRIISGLSRATVVVEASLRSGSLITARHALDQGREVFAVPGPVSSHTSKGCHELLRQGAALLSDIEDLRAAGVLSGYGSANASGGAGVPLAAQLQENRERAGLTLPRESQIILDLLGVEPTHIDNIIRQSGLSPQAVTALLVDLELEGLVDQSAGRNYIKL